MSKLVPNLIDNKKDIMHYSNHSLYLKLGMNHLCLSCLVFLMLSRLFIAVLWSPAGTGLTSLLLLVMFIVFLLLSYVDFWVRCGT